MPRFAANLSLMFTEHAFPDRFAAAAKAGFDSVEFLFPYEYPAQDIASWLGASKLRNVLFNLPPGNQKAGERGLASLPGRTEEFKAGVELALSYAKVLGTPRMHVMAGLLPEGASDAERAGRLDTYVANLRYAAREFAKENRTALIEPINRRDVPGYLIQTQAEAHAVLERVGEPNLKVQMDFYHAQIVEGDLSTKLREYIARVGHIQIAGVPGRREPDVGEINYPYLFRLLDELGYKGWVGCEYHPRGKTEDGLNWLADFRRNAG